jgi:EAL domain-containing protein (putative c-di-GMP-specific phosphodiesterase class I)
MSVAAHTGQPAQVWLLRSAMFLIVGVFNALLAGPTTRQMLARRRVDADVQQMRAGLRAGEFMLFYQPLVAAGSGRIKGMETLLRWQRPGHGIVAPDAFLPAAEATNFIFELDDWVLREACQQLARWRADGVADSSILLGVNISARELDDPGLAQRCITILTESGVKAENVCLEITETALAENSNDLFGELAALRATGVKVALDDFGVGYSSLTRLQHLPIDIIKIDRCFVSGVATSPSDRVLVSSVIELAHQLGCTTVAEGIETPEQLRALQELGCDLIQGFLIGVPEPAAAAAGRLLAQLTAGVAGT